MSKRNWRTGFVPVRRLFTLAGAAAALAAAPVCYAPAAAASGLIGERDIGITTFYEGRTNQSLWFEAGRPNAAAQSLLRLLSTASLDGLDPSDYEIDAVQDAVARAWSGNEKAVRKADRLLSRAFVSYARDLRKNPGEGLQYYDAALGTAPPSGQALLRAAASAPSLDAFVRDMAWMNPNYAPLRRALTEGGYAGEKRAVLQVNLKRARVLPAEAPRYVIVNAAAQRLYMYEGNKLADSMKVVVGQSKDDRKTPIMAGALRYASLNPYWNVPPDLVWDDVGIYVEKYGTKWMTERGYEVLSDWTDAAVPVSPDTVDWAAVKSGAIQIRVRQNPGPRNVLGKVKYTFSNPFGVYLHDTSAKQLLSHDTRLYSGGCIRLEDAARLGAWLFGRELSAQSDAPDIKVEMDKPIPVYVTYLTAVPDGSSITFLDDVYGWDKRRLAELDHGGGGQTASR